MKNDLMALCGATKAERAMLLDMPDDSRELLCQQIKLLALRERRAMLELKALVARGNADAAHPMEDVVLKDARVCGRAAADSEQTSSEQTIKRRSAFELLQELDAQLHRLNEQKLRAIDLLARLDERCPQEANNVKFDICIPDNGRGRAEPHGSGAGERERSKDI